MWLLLFARFDHVLTCFCFGFASLSMFMPTLCVLKVWSTTLERYIRRTKVVVLQV
jgi:hypothetical protein